MRTKTLVISTIGALAAYTTQVLGPAAMADAQQSVWETGWAKLEVWQNQTALSNLISGSIGNPDIVEAVPAFESSTNNEAGDNYDNRVSAIFIPASSGNYTFYTCGDDQCDLFVSIDDTPANKRLVAQETGWSNPWQWTAVGSGTVSQKCSDTWSPDSGVTVPYADGLAMTVGTKYYVEVDHYEGGGGDNVEVTFTKHGDPSPSNGTDTVLLGNVLGISVPRSRVTINQAPTILTPCRSLGRSSRSTRRRTRRSPSARQVTSGTTRPTSLSISG